MFHKYIFIGFNKLHVNVYDNETLVSIWDKEFHEYGLS